MKIVPLAEKLTVSAQPMEPDFATLRDRGARLVINDRPDGEEPGQMDAARAARIAHGLSLEYCHIPVSLWALSADDVDSFSLAPREAPGPVHAHRRSGLRSATLWTLGEVHADRLDVQEATVRLGVAGDDFQAGRAWLDGHAATGQGRGSAA